MAASTITEKRPSANFQPDWMRTTSNPGSLIRQLSAGGNAGGAEMSPTAELAPPVLAKNRYGREDMLALAPRRTGVDEVVRGQIPEFYSADPLVPICDTDYTDAERHLHSVGLNSSKSITAFSRQQQDGFAPHPVSTPFRGASRPFRGRGGLARGSFSGFGGPAPGGRYRPPHASFDDPPNATTTQHKRHDSESGGQDAPPGDWRHSAAPPLADNPRAQALLEGGRSTSAFRRGSGSYNPAGRGGRGSVAPPFRASLTSRVSNLSEDSDMPEWAKDDPLPDVDIGCFDAEGQFQTTGSRGGSGESRDSSAETQEQQQPASKMPQKQRDVALREPKPLQPSPQRQTEVIRSPFANHQHAVQQSNRHSRQEFAEAPVVPKSVVQATPRQPSSTEDVFAPNIMQTVVDHVLVDDDRPAKPKESIPVIEGPESANQWFYKDPRGMVQGPFDSERMHNWFKMGYFKLDLSMKSASDHCFSTLGDLIRQNNDQVPFVSRTAEPAVPARPKLPSPAKPVLGHSQQALPPRRGWPTVETDEPQNSSAPQHQQQQHQQQYSKMPLASVTASDIDIVAANIQNLVAHSVQTASKPDTAAEPTRVAASVPTPQQPPQQQSDELPPVMRLLMQQQHEQERIREQREREQERQLQRKQEQDQLLQQELSRQLESQRLQQQHSVNESPRQHEIETPKSAWDTSSTTTKSEEPTAEDSSPAAAPTFPRETSKLSRKQRRKANEAAKQAGVTEHDTEQTDPEPVLHLKPQKPTTYHQEQRSSNTATTTSAARQHSASTTSNPWSSPEKKPTIPLPSFAPPSIVPGKTLAEIQAEEERAMRAELQQDAQIAVELESRRLAMALQMNEMNRAQQRPRHNGPAWGGVGVVQSQDQVLGATPLEQAGLVESVETRSKSGKKGQLSASARNVAKMQQEQRKSKKTTQPTAQTPAGSHWKVVDPSPVVSGNADSDFLQWCHTEVGRMNADVDPATFVAFLLGMDEPGDVYEYVDGYLGTSRAAQQFAKAFIERRAAATSRHRGDSGGGDSPAAVVEPQQPRQQEAQQQAATSKGSRRKGGKKKVVDLGFRTVADANRYNIGELDMEY